MSKRLQVVFDDQEIEEIRVVAQQHRMTVSEWVRQSLRDARRQEPTHSAATKLGAIERASQHSFPTGDIEQMLEDIARGYEDP